MQIFIYCDIINCEKYNYIILFYAAFILTNIVLFITALVSFLLYERKSVKFVNKSSKCFFRGVLIVDRDYVVD